MGSRIALVDDDQNIIASVALLLEAEGYEVDSYADGEQGLMGLKRRPPDLAILDIKMPRMDGMELLREIRTTSAMPIIFLTSKDDELDEALGLRMGADDYITKPFSQRLLLERVRAILRRTERGAGGDSAEMLVLGDMVLDPDRHSCTWKGKDVKLTVTEFLILSALMRRPGIVKTATNYWTRRMAMMSILMTAPLIAILNGSAASSANTIKTLTKLKPFMG